MMNQDQIILDAFEKYLESKGYSRETPNGNRSTCYDYSKVRIPSVCRREGISVSYLAKNIDSLIDKYDQFGVEADFGDKGHRAVINALKRFREFYKTSSI